METIISAITVVETDKLISDNEELSVDEAPIEAKRCVKFGIVAIVCADCPMARFCAVRAEAAQEQLIDEPTPEVPDSKIEDSTKQDPLQNIETEKTIDNSLQEKTVNLQSPERSHSQKLTYLERLLDDDIEIVIADSLLGESGSSTYEDDLPQKSKDVYVAKNVVNKNDGSEFVNDLSLPEKLSFGKKEIINDGFKKELAVILDELERSHQATLYLGDKENLSITAVPAKEEVLNIIPDTKPTVSEVYSAPKMTAGETSTFAHEEILTVVTEKISSPVTNIAKIAPPIFESKRFEQKAEVSEDKSLIKSIVKQKTEEPVVYSNEFIASDIREQIEDIFSDSFTEIIHKDVRPEEVVVEENYIGPVADESGLIQKIRYVKRDYKVEEKVEIDIDVDVDEPESPIIDIEDTIDPEFGLSSLPVATVNNSVGVLRRLAILVFYQLRV